MVNDSDPFSDMFEQLENPFYKANEKDYYNSSGKDKNYHLINSIYSAIDERPQETLNKYGEWLKMHAKNWSKEDLLLSNALVEFLINAMDFDNAYSILNDHPQYSNRNEFLGLMKYVAGEYKEARGILIDNHSLEASKLALISSGSISREIIPSDLSIELLKKCRRESPLVSKMLGIEYFNSGIFDEALKCFEERLTQIPSIGEEDRLLYLIARYRIDPQNFEWDTLGKFYYETDSTMKYDELYNELGRVHLNVPVVNLEGRLPMLSKKLLRSSS